MDVAGGCIQRAGDNGLGMDIQTNKGTLKHVGASLASNAGSTSEHPQATDLEGVFGAG
ncbi:hypothetical protein GCM10007173_19050 [Glutamicibacter ardleyensis]|uniref:Uncharacterized protein n=1 Tax=Glutamicibacter ardleyensis TaxID=225894 RepID=A0ABQ2DKK9_9MICC|nr:hypothetical protein GCM10007173_19050 [Glutamicibacter ardleyensis]